MKNTKRWDLITADVYVETMVECIICYSSSVPAMRAQMVDFIKKFRDELLPKERDDEMSVAMNDASSTDDDKQRKGINL